MTAALRQKFDRVWFVDFEYYTGTSGGDAPDPICMVAREMFTGELVRRWLWKQNVDCPFDVGERTLYVAYYASAEVTCHLAMGWPVPKRVLDLQVEFRWLNNGFDRHISPTEKDALKKGEKYSLLAALWAYGYGSEALSISEKDHWRSLCIRGGPYTEAERHGILDYCETDVRALPMLLGRMGDHIHAELPAALWRGRYVTNLASVERRGMPINGGLLRSIEANYQDLVMELIDRHQDEFDVFGYRDLNAEKFKAWVADHGFRNWPTTPTGKLKTDRDTLRDIGRQIPIVQQLSEILRTVREARMLERLPIGSDNRNRYLASPFASKTGRNQPSSSKNIFGPARWVRSLIEPPPGRALIHADWSGQEYGIAAYFSGDPGMIHDYQHDDPYLGFAKRIGLAPDDATKASHKVLRDQLKVAAGLGVLYGAGAETVAAAGGMSLSMAGHVLKQHRRMYPVFWAWRQQIVDTGRTDGFLRTCFGWQFIVKDSAGSRTLCNWPMQAAGAEMLRAATCLGVERGLEVCALVHDAMWVECDIDDVEHVRSETVRTMNEASRLVLRGPTLKVGVDPPITHPGRYSDGDGDRMYSTVVDIVAQIEEAIQG